MGVRVGPTTPELVYVGATPVAVYVGEQLEHAKAGHLRPTLTPVPAYENVGTGLSSIRWNFGGIAGATAISFERPDGHVLATTGTHFDESPPDATSDVRRILKATNPTGTSETAATFKRDTPVVVEVGTPRALSQRVSGLIVYSRFAVPIMVTGDPFPTDLAITQAPGAPSNSQLQRWFEYEAERVGHLRMHVAVFRRVDTVGTHGDVRYTVSGSNRGGADSDSFDLTW